ncbi:MAG: PAS domain-containing protein [Kordiimonadaceae bacterium]|nr:PAS domain-containing protein [Kordiimonadaceae bacterium]
MPRGGGRAPLKSTFSPTKLRRLTPNLFMLERCSEKEISVRLMGSELEVALDRDVPDYTVFDTLLAKDWQFYDRFLKACGGASCAGRFARSVQTNDGCTVDVEALGVPLADKEGEPRYMLGVMVARLRHKGPANPSIPVRRRLDVLDHEFVDLGHGTPENIGADSDIDGPPTNIIN